MTPPPGTGRLTVLVGEGDAVGHAPLHTEMVQQHTPRVSGGARVLLDGATESWQSGLVTVEDVTVVGPPGGNRPR